MKVLVTGGAGFIGSHMAHYHIDKNDEVFVIDNFQGGSEKNIADLYDNPRFHFINEDILTSKELEKVIGNVDRIYHFAALLGMFNVIAHPVLTLDINIKTTERVLDLIKDLKNKPVLVVASSSEVYGNQAGLLKEENPLTVHSSLKNHATYPISKLCNESSAYSYFRQYDVPCIIARIF